MILDSCNSVKGVTDFWCNTTTDMLQLLEIGVRERQTYNARTNKDRRNNIEEYYLSEPMSAQLHRNKAQYIWTCIKLLFTANVVNSISNAWTRGARSAFKNKN